MQPRRLSALTTENERLATENERLAKENERLSALDREQVDLQQVTAETRILKAQVDALHAGQTTQGCLAGCAGLRESVEQLQALQKRLLPFVPEASMCRKFRHGNCTQGAACPRLHVMPPCRFHKSPSGCARGEACRFAHVALPKQPVRLVPAKRRAEDDWAH